MSTAHVGLIIFTVAYVGIALGRLPGLALDRTGVALLGAMLIVVCGVLSVEQALAAVDVPTLILLFGLMLLSAQYRLGGFYTLLAATAARRAETPEGFLARLIVISGVLSALLSNDVICLALTPIVCEVARLRRWNALPFLLALAAASNVGSAATLIGNPQNMYIGQKADLDFAAFLLWCLPPTMASLWGLYAWAVWRGGLTQDGRAPLASLELHEGRPYDAHQSRKAVLLTAVLVALFFTPVPRELTVLGIASILLLSRKLTSRQFLALVDWALLVLFIGLFVLIEGFRAAGGMAMLMDGFERLRIDLYHPAVYSVLSIVLSNLVSNVPAVMLLMADWPQEHATLAYLLALTSTYAGNLLLIGSIANLIVAEQARPAGVEITFAAHARWTAPFALASLVVAVSWWLLLQNAPG